MNKDDIAALEKFVFDAYSNDSMYEEVFADIDSIRVNPTTKKITIKISNPDVVGLFIGKKGANVKAVQIKINKKFPSGWRLMFNGGSKISGSGQKGDFKDDRRKIILKEGLPLTIPFSSLKDEKIVNHITTHVSNGDPVLVTLFRDSMGESTNKLLSEVKGNMGKRMLNFLLQVMEKFPEFEIAPFNWPDIHRSRYDTKRSTHPLISHHCRAAAIISSKENPVTNLSRFESALTEAVHSEILKNSRDKWVIVGDETGDLSEFEAKPSPNVASGRWHSAMCWIAIPPKSNLPALSLDFHCSGSGGIPNYIKAINNLTNCDDILCFSFPFQQGTITKNASDFGQDPHLSLWQDTLPIVLEHLSTKINSPSQVDIFIEQVGILESGSTLIQPISSGLITSLKHRKGWENISFDELWVVSKNPLEHPWIGYPDALGANENEKYKKLKGKNLQNAKELLNCTISAPYRQDSLNGQINPALKNTAHPLVFLKSLSNLPSEDIRDYVEPFFSSAIPEALSSLKQTEWQDLLEHIDNTSSGKQGQRATALMHNHIDFEATLIKLERQSDQFDLLRMMLGTSNHRGAISQGIKCKEKCEEMIASGFSPTDEKLRKFHNLLPGLRDNMFDFSNLDEEIPDYSSDMSDPQIHFLGTKAQSLGLTGIPEYRKLAIQIEEKLSEHGDDRRHHKRHFILLAELLLDEGNRIDEAQILLEQLSKKLLESEEELLSDSYYVATLLKMYALSKADKSVFTSKTKTVLSLLDDDHPSQRIAYWCARWAIEIGESDTPLAKDCFQHLLDLTEVPLFTHDAPGVILSCELFDLVNRGYSTDFNVDDYHQMVLDNSQESTKEWVLSFAPNEEDWLAPLNSNYW
jgi:hypothetical protein